MTYITDSPRYRHGIARRRLDTLLAERGLAPSRSAAATSIRAGYVRVGAGGARATKPSQLIALDTELVVEEPQRYVSRGGLKIEGALDALGVSVDGLDCLDVGASTGGFTDCLLQRGAGRVIALDVGRGQLEWRLRNDERVSVIEGMNARTLAGDDLPFAPHFVTVDVSFISLKKILPALANCMTAGGRIMALVKPQFELGPKRVGKGGIVRSIEARSEAIESVARAGESLGLGVIGIAPAALRGAKGNQETFLLFDRGAPRHSDLESAMLRVGV